MRLLTAAVLAVLVLSACVSADGSRTVLGSDLTGDTVEHQRILEELEQVHQLRERMLQEGE